MIETIILYIANTSLAISIPVTLALAACMSLIGTILAYELYTFPELAANNDIVNAKYGYFGGIFAVSLGLALVGAYGVYADYRDASIREVASLRSLYYSLPAKGSARLSPADAAKKDAVLEYARTVIDLEWKVTPSGDGSDRSALALKKLFDVFVGDPGENHLLDSHLHWLNDAVEAHAMRAPSDSRAVSVMVWTILLFGTVIAIIVPLFMGTPYFLTQAILSSLFSAFIMLHLLAIIHLAYPINDDVGVTAVAYQQFLDEAARIDAQIGKP